MGSLKKKMHLVVMNSLSIIFQAESGVSQQYYKKLKTILNDDFIEFFQIEHFTDI